MIMTPETIIDFIEEEFDQSVPEAELIKQVFEQLQAGETVAPGDEFLCPGYILIIEGEPDED
jgi:hypothetical protein